MIALRSPIFGLAKLAARAGNAIVAMTIESSSSFDMARLRRAYAAPLSLRDDFRALRHVS